SSKKTSAWLRSWRLSSTAVRGGAELDTIVHSRTFDRMRGRWMGRLALALACSACGETTSGTGGDGSGSSGGNGDGGSGAGSTGRGGSSSGGGSSGGGSSGGSGGTDSGSSVQQLRHTGVDKMDLLFVVDNSTSMADKQALLGRAVPALVERLVHPDCVRTDGDGRVTGRQPAENGSCPDDFQLAFTPLDDIHIGIITSSLGGHGGDLCSSAAPNWNETQNDRARLLPTVRPDLDLPTS